MDRHAPVNKTKIVADVASLGTTTRLNTASCRLVVTSGADKGRVYVLRRGDVATVGTDPGVEVPVADPTVSRRHATLELVDGGARLMDLESTNGTFYEGSRIRAVEIPFGATVAMGKTQLKVLPEEESVELGPAPEDSFGGIVGHDRRMREIFALLADIAPTDTTVLIEGETGTGKEVVARAIHEASKRRAKAFVVFDCSAVPANLVESALFGHVRGAFTGAAGARAGAFRSATGGTLFLDEIGELPLEMQPKLLRVLETRTVQAVGQDNYEKVDVRVVAATNRSLKAEVRAGRFREDLYYRLAVVRAAMPSLRDRPGDISMLVQHFMQAAGGRPRTVDPAGLAALEKYGFPGNVRELKNIVERTMHLTAPGEPLDFSRFIQAADDDEPLVPRSPSNTAPVMAHSLVEPGPVTVETTVPAAFRGGATATSPATSSPAVPALEARAEWPGAPGPWEQPFKEAKQLVTDAFEKRYLQQLLTRSQQNLSRAAQQAQVDRKHLRELLRKHGLWAGPDDGGGG